MPIYEYQCPDCGHVFEEWVNITSANDEAPCPECGQQAVHIISNTAFVLKGSGWYVTDYGSRKNDGHQEGQASAPTNHGTSSGISADASAAATSSSTSSDKDGSAAPASQPAAAPAAPTVAKESPAPAATSATGA